MITREHARRATEPAPQISDEQIRRAWRDHREGVLIGWRTPPAIVDSSTRGPQLVGTSTWVRPQTATPHVVSVKSYDLQAMRAEMLLTSIPVAQTNTGGSYSSAGQITIPLDPEAQSNDVVVLYIQTAAQGTLTPAGWTAILTETVGTGGAAGATALSTFYRRINQRTDDNTAALSDSGDHQFAVEIVVRGCVESGNPIDISSGGTVGVATTAVSVPTATTVTNNCLVLAAVGHAVGNGQKLSGWTNANLSSVAELYDNSATSGTVAGGIGIGMGGLATAGATGATTATLATLSNQALITLALKPAANSGIGIGNPTVAPPYYVAQSTATSVDSGAGTSIAWPAGHASNDIALLFIQTPNVSVASVSGFNFACTGVTGSANTSGAVMGSLYWARATSGSMPATTIFLSSPSSTVVAAVMVAVRGAYALGTPFQGTPSAGTSASSTTVTHNGSPATADNLLRVWGVFNGTNSASPQTSGETATTVADFTEVADYNVANGGSNGGGGVGICFGTNGPTGQNLTANPALTATLANASVSVDITALLLPSSFTGQALVSAIGAETDTGLIQLAGTTPLASDVTIADYSNASTLQLSWPSTLQVNDIGILLVQTNAQASTVFPLLSTNTVSSGGAPISAFSAITNTPQTTGSAGVAGAVALSAFWCRATAADVLLTSLGAPGVIINDSGVQQVAVLLVYRGCLEYDNPWDVTAGSAATTSTSVSIPGATTATNNCLVVTAVANATSTTTQQASGWTNASLSDLFEVIDLNTTVGNGGGISAAQGRLATAGAYSATTATLASSSAQAKFSVALKPAVTKYGSTSPFVYQSGVVASQAVAGASAVTVAWPATHQANDVALLYVETENETPSLSTPSGFALLSSQGTGTANAAGSTGLWIYWCRATTSAQASVVIAAATGHLVVGLHTFRNCITTGNPWEDVQGTVASVASTTATMPAVTTTEPNAFVLQCCAGAVATTGVTAITNSGLSGMVVTRNSGSALGNTPGHTLVVASDKSGAAGSTGTTTATITSTKQALISIAFKAAPRSSVGSTAGTATATAVGASTAVAPGSTAGTATATAIGFGSTASVGAAAGTATATAVGVIPISSAVGAAAGTSTATGVGASTAAAPATAAGTSTAAAVPEVHGSAAGTATPTAVGASTAAAASSAAGTATPTAVGASTATAAGSSAGTATPTATGKSTATAAGSAAGTSAATATGASTATAKANAIGTRILTAASGVTFYANTGASSVQTIAGDGYIEYTCADNALGAVIGFSASDTDKSYTSINYAIVFSPNTGAFFASAYELGTFKAQLTPRSPGDVYRITRTGTTITYAKNGSVFYTSLTASSGAIGIDTAFQANSSAIDGIRLVDNGVEVALTWKNSANVTITQLSGQATATGIGASTLAAAGSSAGTSTATASGIGLNLGTGSSAGTATPTATGKSTATAAGAAAGTTALRASLHLATVSLSGTVEVIAAGPSGNSFTLATAADGTGAGSLTNSGNAYTYHYSTGNTLVSDFENVINASGVLRMRSAPGTVFVLQSPGDTFSAQAFTGGADGVAATGKSTATAAGSSAGTAAPTATGASTAAATGTSAGTSTATATGKSTAAATGTSAGTSTATAVGTGITPTTGASAGAANDNATGASTATAAGSSAGTATPTATGASTATAAGSSAGIGAAPGIGASIAAATGTSAGASTAAATGASTAAAAGTSAGTSTATATGTAIDSATGTSTGTSTAAATGIELHKAIASSTGIAVARAVGAPQNVTHAADDTAPSNTVDTSATATNTLDNSDIYETEADFTN